MIFNCSLCSIWRSNNYWNYCIWLFCWVSLLNIINFKLYPFISRSRYKQTCNWYEIKLQWDTFVDGSLLTYFSLFPFYLFLSNGELIQLLRILRMPKLMSLIDVKRTRKIVNSFFENASREEKVLINNFVINAYRIIRLIVIAAIITYFFGCFWYIISDNLNSSGDQKTFINKYGLKNEDTFRKLITIVYSFWRSIFNIQT